MADAAHTHPLNALPLGHLLQDEYRIEQVLGAGGFGITYLALDGFGRPVAIKEYLPNELAVRVSGATQVSARSGQDSDDFHWGLRKFREEGAKLAAFDHPHINRVLRLFQANGTAYLVLEYIQGKTLSQALEAGDGQLPAAPLQRMLGELLQALQAVHEAGLVHCDVKPSNIMLRDEGGSAVLLDFGASRQAVSQRTRSATSAYTPPYAALEQYEQDSPDLGPWTDLYGLGMVAYRCISGRPEKKLPDAVTRAKWQRRAQPSNGMEPAVEVGAGRYAEALLKAVDWALQIEERMRPGSAEALREVLAGSAEPAAAQRTPSDRNDGPNRATATTVQVDESDRVEDDSADIAQPPPKKIAAPSDVRRWRTIAVVSGLGATVAAASSLSLYADRDAEQTRRFEAEARTLHETSQKNGIQGQLDAANRRVALLERQLLEADGRITALSRTAEERDRALREREQRVRDAEAERQAAEQQAKDAERERQRLAEDVQRRATSVERRIELCNRSAQDVFAAVASFHNTVWFTNGWYEVKQASCRTLHFRSEVPLLINAHRRGGQQIPAPPDNRGMLCIDPVNAFTNLTDTTCSHNQSGRGFSRVQFGRHDAGSNGLQRITFD